MQNKRFLVVPIGSTTEYMIEKDHELSYKQSKATIIIPPNQLAIPPL